MLVAFLLHTVHSMNIYYLAIFTLYYSKLLKEKNGLIDSTALGSKTAKYSVMHICSMLR